MSLEHSRAIVYGTALGHAIGARSEHEGQAKFDSVSSVEVCTDMTLPADLFGDANLWRTHALLIGYAYHDQLSALHSAAERAWLFSDGEAPPYAASLAAALLIALSLQGIHDHEYARRIVEGCDGVSETLDAAFYRLGHALAWGDERGAMEYIGRERDAESMIALACYCVMRYPTRFDLAVERAANSGDGRARLAYLVGGMMGAKLGLGSIPQDWLAMCSKNPILDEIAMSGEALRRERT